MLDILIPVAAVAGLVAVVLEILVKDPRALTEITTDVRAMARPSVAARRSAQPANTNAGRHVRAA